MNLIDKPISQTCLIAHSRYNWEHYGNPDGPQAMQFGIGLPAWIVEERNSIWVLGLYTLVFMIGLPTVVYYWWSNSIKFSGEQVCAIFACRRFSVHEKGEMACV